MLLTFRLDHHDFDPDRFNDIKQEEKSQKKTLNKFYLIDWVAIKQTTE